jgi:hypothetical protein
MNITARLRTLMAPKRRRSVGTIWVLLNLFYEVARAVVVTLLFAEHGVNGIYYLAFCLFFAVFFYFVMRRENIELNPL